MCEHNELFSCLEEVLNLFFYADEFCLAGLVPHAEHTVDHAAVSHAHTAVDHVALVQLLAVHVLDHVVYTLLNFLQTVICVV